MLHKYLLISSSLKKSWVVDAIGIPTFQFKVEELRKLLEIISFLNYPEESGHRQTSSRHRPDLLNKNYGSFKRPGMANDSCQSGLESVLVVTS